MRCLYLEPRGGLGSVDDARLDSTTERHSIQLNVLPYGPQSAPVTALSHDPGLGGLIMEIECGYVGRNRLRLARRVLALGRRVWAYWPGEQALECIDDERLGSLWRHWVFVKGYRAGVRIRESARAASDAPRRAARGALHKARSFLQMAPREGIGPATRAAVSQLAKIAAGDPSSSIQAAEQRLARLDALIGQTAPVPFAAIGDEPSPGDPIRGVGTYLRADWWAQIESGGSYGHTCYVAKELAAVTERFVCFMAHRYRMLDQYGLRQVVLEPRSQTASEDEIVTATDHYYRLLKPAFEALRPAYLYERICLGNYTGALLSRELGIPYIVEYNGSEISMRRSFDGVGYVHEADYLKAEALAFRQATMISVISRQVKADLVGRGIDPDKILVNPNGADPAIYAPATPEEKRSIRQSVGLAADTVVVGFTGTFGGWHGVDVLAAALPTICRRTPNVQFLLIGDGAYKHLVDGAVEVHGLHDRVRMVGRVPQAEGARLLKVCDLFVSPHNSHMIDSKFFGSPTKVFEYMAMGGGIVASDLEQIGESLSPALDVGDALNPASVVTDERSVLCTPGDVDEFVEAVVALANRPDLQAALGRNARKAVLDHYSWNRHVAQLWPFIRGDRRLEPGRGDSVRAPRVPRKLEPQSVLVGAGVGAAVQASPVATGDHYKDEVQRQWDNDPAGSHYVKVATPHTLAWFIEAQAYRYGEYAPWMAETMEFAAHANEDLLEIGGGMGTDLVQFAQHGARTTDLDLSAGHLELATEHFHHRGLSGRFVHHDAEMLPFEDSSFDVVYSNGVLHHTPNTRAVVREIARVLRPGGKAIVMMYAENSLHYWRNLVWAIGLKDALLDRYSMGEIMSRSVERSDNAAARPLVKVYTRRRLTAMFAGFEDIRIVQRQMVAAEVPRLLSRVPVATLGRLMGWNLVIKARKPRT